MSFFKKWYTYQKERFPVVAYGSYVFAIAFATYCFVSAEYIRFSLIESFVFNWKILLVMFFVGLLQFLMVRIIDEFKDYEEDCKYRPYRPVPRGLIKLSELKVLFIICALLQIAITAYINLYGLILLALLWLFFFFMSKGFFIKKILDKHILLEVTFDELMMPVLVLYLSIFPYGRVLISKAYLIFLVMTYVVSWIIEIARKVRCKEDEEEGVKTYTAVFGIKSAMLILFALQLILFSLQSMILGIHWLILTIALFAIVCLIDLLFAIKQSKKLSKLTELFANIHVFLVYFSMILLVL
jgi:4-hydroxybenzoate polyprenyltransferase